MTRQEAIERIKNDIEINHNRLANEYITALNMAIKALEQEPKRGKWGKYLKEGLKWKCSECGSRYTVTWSYCPNCGARMEEEQ